MGSAFEGLRSCSERLLTWLRQHPHSPPGYSGAKFVAVQNKIVALRTHFPWCGFELVQVLIDNASERVLRADPGLFRLAPFEQRKAGDPEKPPLRLVGQIERFAELQTQLSRDERSGFRAFDLFLRGNTNN